MATIKVLDKTFRKYISADKIDDRIREMARQINHDLNSKEVVFIGVLNGSFMFVSDLMKNINFPCQITFIKVSSYQGTASTGNVKQLIGLNEDIAGKTVVVLEDIIDTGITLKQIHNELLNFQPAEIRYAALLLKPEAYRGDLNIDYVGFKIPNDFIIGYGLDYNGYGRNLSDIYVIAE
ncbi:MAG TPA: hypoxanthine phosphoribosyltransferase [Salinivirgaceae bacterium]|nr:hypoxanthine phosphoribosyltransferase [Salinivirgaceae bacterium]